MTSWRAKLWGAGMQHFACMPRWRAEFSEERATGIREPRAGIFFVVLLLQFDDSSCCCLQSTKKDLIMSVPKAAYSVTAAYYHWVVAFPLMGCVGTVLKAQAAPKEEKGAWMHRHKSLGLLTGILVAPRIGYRLFSSQAYNVEKIAGSSGVEHMLGKLGHYGLYAFMTIMPATGIAMGYYGGKGLPFFWTTIPGVVKTEENKKSTGAIAKQSYGIHKQLGTYGKYLVPLHVAGAFSHYVRGQTIFSRMNPFRSPKH